jgi:type VI secretion system protein ImpL
MVTKGDLVQGMTKFCDRFSEKTLEQAMGVINHNLSKDAIALLRRAIGLIADRLRDLRLILFHKTDSQGQGVDPALLLFPEEFEKLEPGLQSFFRGAFQENPYQETPLLRGVFFSSGRQEGSPYSHFLSALGLIQERDVLPGTNKGLFLHDFFGRILPKDRGLFAPTRRALEWSRLTKNLGLTSWIALALAICGLLSFSFVKNLRTIRSVSSEFERPPVLQGDIVSDVVIMDHFRKAIVKVEEQNEDWWIPRFGLHESLEVETGLKEKFCEQFKGGFLVPFDKAMARRMADFSNATDDETLGQHVAHLTRRINLLRARLEGEPFEMLQQKPQPTYASISSVADQKLIPEIKKKFSVLYLDYLIWQSDESGLNREMIDLQTWLKHVLTLKETDLHWIVNWVNTEEDLVPVTLKDLPN